MDNFLDDEHNWLNNNIALQACQPAISLEKDRKMAKKRKVSFHFREGIFHNLRPQWDNNTKRRNRERVTIYRLTNLGGWSSVCLQVTNWKYTFKRNTPEQSRGVFTRIDQEWKIPSINLGLETVSVVTSSRYREVQEGCACARHSTIVMRLRRGECGVKNKSDNSTQHITKCFDCNGKALISIVHFSVLAYCRQKRVLFFAMFF